MITWQMLCYLVAVVGILSGLLIGLLESRARSRRIREHAHRLASNERFLRDMGLHRFRGE